jgi:hypothetical protein
MKQLSFLLFLIEVVVSFKTVFKNLVQIKKINI